MSSPTLKPAAQPAPRRQDQPPCSPKYPRHGASSTPDASAQQTNHSHTHGALPLSFRLPFQTKSTSASLVPSVAEGRPIQVDDSTAEHRTEALRELNSHYPSRHRYAKSTGAENTTYSEPVIVRSYYRPPPNRVKRLPHGTGGGGSSSSSAGIIVVCNGHSTAASVNGSVASRTRTSPLAGKVASASSGMLSIMARARGLHPQFGHRPPPEDAKLPPIEAFSFKSFLESMNEQDNTATGSDINADLDRIAEICARSRYSLSNQYEVHYGPHGSSHAFMAGGRSGPESQGPTLQAVTSDDETSTTTERQRRLGGRRNSRAMGTLETIMSSSRSSDDDHSKKKSAAELADDVRGRASTKTSHHTSPAGSTASVRQARTPQDPSQQRPTVRRTPSSSLALIDTASKTTAAAPSVPTTAYAAASHLASIVSLAGDPALPQSCTSNLQVYTASSSAADAISAANMVSGGGPHPTPTDRGVKPLLSRPAANGVAVSSVDGATATGLLSALAGWIPWSSNSSSGAAPPPPRQDRATGSLRSLLNMADDGPHHEEQ
ncbi:hypothetical protein CCM_03191 [Cordyceps militaris CM01]|uniref:Uncharacterized protein n=1 Tax=Cordyceps militaris (strain CM01) TaxID=983644 RepID=G3J9E2_CORMM|nr:uncharacterized protein CCM_03191 [Cordyceps militaris CM01]EGX94919.1 hypothetical protein CCM_03191 [Cordyceps militaris CM01]